MTPTGLWSVPGELVLKCVCVKSSKPADRPSCTPVLSVSLMPDLLTRNFSCDQSAAVPKPALPALLLSCIGKCCRLANRV